MVAVVVPAQQQWRVQKVCGVKQGKHAIVLGRRQAAVVKGRPTVAHTLLMRSAWLRALNSWKQLLMLHRTSAVRGGRRMPTAVAALSSAAV